VLFPLVDRPWLMSALAFVLLWAVARFGAFVKNWRAGITTAEHSDLDLVRNATFTLLAVLLGFSLSMAVSRYDLRKTYEEEEANAIGTENARLDLLPAETASTTRAALIDYTRLRLVYYSSQNPDELRRAEIDTAKLQGEMWAAVSTAANQQSTPVAALAAAGMNDVLNSQGYALAAWRNRLPVEVWGLLLFVAIGANFLVGFGSYSSSLWDLWLLALTTAVAFLLIAEIDSPRNGFVRVHPQNLVDVAESIGAKPP
jgi:hypothetical protein